MAARVWWLEAATLGTRAAVRSWMEGGGGGASAFSLGMHHGWKGGRSREIRAASRKEGGGALSFMRKKTAQSLTCGTHLSARKGVGPRW